MASVMSLLDMCQWVAARALINISEQSTRDTSFYMLSLLKTERYHSVAQGLLECLVEDYPDKLTDELLTSIVPVHLTELKLKSCSRLTSLGLLETLKRCRKVRNIELTGCDGLLKNTDVLWRTLSHCPTITHLSLEDCASIDSDNVQMMLRGLPILRHLCLSSCSGITNEAFNVKKENEQSSQQIVLTSVDISACRQLTTMVVWYLTELCGTTLRHLNLAGTAVDPSALAYLCGYCLDDVLEWEQSKEYISEEGVFLSTLLSGPVYNEDDHTNKTSTDTCEPNVSTSTHKYDQNNFAEDSGFDQNQEHSHLQLSNVDVGDNCSDENSCDIGLHGEATALCKNIEDIDITKNKIDCLECKENDNCDHLTSTPVLQRQINSDPVSSDKSKSSANCTCSSRKQVSDPPLEQQPSELPGNVVHSDRHIDMKHSANIIEQPCDIEKDDCDEKVMPDSLCRDHNTSFDSPVDSCSHTSHSASAPRESECREFWARPRVFSSDNGSHNNTKNCKRYQCNLVSLNISYIPFCSKEMAYLYLALLFQSNKHMERFSISWSEMDDSLLEIMAETVASTLTHLDMFECDSISTHGLVALWKKCNNLQCVNLRGVCFFSDSGLNPLITNCGATLKSLIVCESEIGDNTLISLARSCREKLEELDISWCEEITPVGVEYIASCCGQLKHLAMRQVDTDPQTIPLLALNCKKLVKLNVSSVTNLDDTSLVAISVNLHRLQHLDISWNVEVTDVGVSALLNNCNNLRCAVFSGLKQLTIAPFVRLISDSEKWKRCQALLRLKLHERQVLEKEGDAHLSSDKEYDELHFPQRSMTFAPRLSFMDLEYCDRLDDRLLSDVVAVCQGTLRVRDYYGEDIVPAWLVSKKGCVYLPPST